MCAARLSGSLDYNIVDRQIQRVEITGNSFRQMMMMMMCVIG